jgi:O-antigen/teichoic acid export membrane protein
MSLKQRLVAGIFWSFINLFLIRGASFFSTILLARILTPEDFGLLGMIVVFMGIGSTLVNSGLSQSLIRSKNVSQSDLSTIFFTNIAFSVVIYLIIFFLAPIIAAFYEQEILISIIRIYCLGFVISATSSVQSAVLTRDMKFKKVTQYQIPATILSVSAGIYFALQGFGVWSLVWMFLINQIVRSAVFWYKSDWRVTLIYDFDVVKHHLNFGYKLMLSSLLNTVFSNLYNILIGKFYPLSVLGFFERSRTFQHYVVSTMTEIISNVSYPLLSKMQEDREKLVSIFKKINMIAFFLICPVMLGLSVLATPLFNLVLGPNWHEAVPYFQLLCVGAVLYPIHFLNIGLLKVLGRSDLFLKIEFLKIILVTVVISICFKYGVKGLLYSTIISSILALFINTYYTNKLVGYGVFKQLRDLFPYLVLSIITIGTIHYVYLLTFDYSLFIQLIVPSFIGILFYIGASYVLKLMAVVELHGLLKNIDL